MCATFPEENWTAVRIAAAAGRRDLLKLIIFLSKYQAGQYTLQSCHNRWYKRGALLYIASSFPATSMSSTSSVLWPVGGTQVQQQIACSCVICFLFQPSDVAAILLMNHNIPVKQLNKIFFYHFGGEREVLRESLGRLRNSSLQVMLLWWYIVVFRPELKRSFGYLWHWVVELPAFHCFWTETVFNAS